MGALGDFMDEQDQEIFDLKDRIKELEDPEAKAEQRMNLVAEFMEYCKEKGHELPDSLFESFFGA